MKKTEIATIILVAAISVVATYFLATALLADKIKQNRSAPTISAISNSVQQPSKEVFNSDALNPTVEVRVEQDVQGTTGSSVNVLEQPATQNGR